MVVDSDAAYPVRFDASALFESVGESLDFSAEISPAGLAAMRD